MQDLPAIREWVDITLANYARQIGQPKPELNFDGAKEDKHKHCNCEPKARYTKGISCKKCNTVFINLKTHDSVKELENTIVHELTHLRFPKMKEHGEEFFITMGMIMMGKPYKRIHRKNKK